MTPPYCRCLTYSRCDVVRYFTTARYGLFFPAKYLQTKCRFVRSTAASLLKELQWYDFCHQIEIVIRVKKKKIIF